MKPRYPRAGLRDEMQGTAVLSYDVEAGKPTKAKLVRSSGWAVLDEAALEALALCEFDAGTAKRVKSVV